MLLDMRGLNCPLPEGRTREMLRQLAQRDRLTVERTDPLAAIDIPHRLHETGDTLERQEAANGLFIFHIKREKAWEQHFFARGSPMRRGRGAVSLHRKAMPWCRPGDGRPIFQPARRPLLLWDFQAHVPPRRFR
jgi:tRNA 2-thiouridine synthesizing protein A